MSADLGGADTEAGRTLQAGEDEVGGARGVGQDCALAAQGQEAYHLTDGDFGLEEGGGAQEPAPGSD